MRKSQPATGFDIACKCQRNYRGWTVDEAWFILTEGGSLPAALAAYKQRMGIEEMFRDCQTGGDNLEGTSLKGNRLINMILLMALAYLGAVVQGTEVHNMQVQRYVSRHQEPNKKYRRRSIFGVGLDGEKWVNYLAQYSESVKRVNEVNSK